MKIITILTAAALGLTAVVAAAQTSMKVSYADLNIDSPEGKTTLAHRIKHAADMVCDRSEGVTTLADHVSARICRTMAVSNAMKEIEARTTPRYASR